MPRQGASSRAAFFLPPLVGGSQREGVALRRGTLTLTLSHQGRGKAVIGRFLHRPLLLPVGLLPKEVFVATALDKMFLQSLPLGG
jgi:hypothetical protein